MLKRDQRFIPEKHRVGVIGYLRVFGVVLLCASAAVGVFSAANSLMSSSSTDVSNVLELDPIKDDWKRRPEDPQGIAFLNKGLEINRVQAELFDTPNPEEIVLAPPPDDF